MDNHPFSDRYDDHESGEYFNLNINPDIKVFPNPAKDVINKTSDANIRWVKLINLTGQLVMDKAVNGINIQVDISQYTEGLYFIQLET